MTASSTLDFAALSRKELQAIAKELSLCRGNAKNDVILQHLQTFVAKNPTNGEARVRAVLEASTDDASSEPPTPTKATTPAPKKVAAPAAVVAEAPKTKKAPVAPKAAAPAAAKTKKAALEQPKAAAKAPPAAPVAKAPVAPAAKATAKATTKADRPALATLDTNAKSMKAAALDAITDVDALVASLPDLAFVGDGNRVKCTTTGHEMQATVAIIKAYVQGKRYEKAQLQLQSFKTFAPMFVPHPKSPETLMWCSVTETSFPRNVERIEAHIAGSRYQQALPDWQIAQAAAAKEAAAAAARKAARMQARAAKMEAIAAGSVDAAKKDKKNKNKKRKATEIAVAVEKPMTSETKSETKSEKKSEKRQRKRVHGARK